MVKVILTDHVKDRLLHRNIGVHDAKQIAKKGKVIKSEQSGIIKVGLSCNKKPIIVIVKEINNKIIIITAYYEN